MNTTFPLTLWRTFSRGRREQRTWRSFVDTFIAQPEVAPNKKSVAGFSLGAFNGNRRSLSRVEAVHALVLDFDEGDTTLKQARGLLPGTHGVAYTTFNHAPEKPKLRAVFPLSRPVDANEYARVWGWAARRITRAGHVLDESARDASRFWYLPSHRPRAPYEWGELEGRALDVKRALKEGGGPPLPSFPGGGQALGGKPKGKGRERGAPLFDPSEADQTFFGRAFEHAEMTFGSLENGALVVACPWSSAHTSGVDGDSSTVVFPPTTDSGWGLFHCSHAHCSRRTTADLLDVLPVAALEKARREHGRGLMRARILDGWEQRLEAVDEFPALDRFVLKCRPRGDDVAGVGAVFTMTVKLGSSLHAEYLGGLPLPLLIGRRVDVSMEDKTVRAARLVWNELVSTKAEQRARGAMLLSANAPGALITGADFDFLLAVLCRGSAAQVGPGVRKIRVRGDGKCFEVVRVDGSCVDLGKSLLPRL